jgi:hypothetical protein
MKYIPVNRVLFFCFQAVSDFCVDPNAFVLRTLEPKVSPGIIFNSPEHEWSKVI